MTVIDPGGAKRRFHTGDGSKIDTNRRLLLILRSPTMGQFLYYTADFMALYLCPFGGKIRDHSWGNLRLVVGKAAMLPPERKLDYKSELTGVNAPSQHRQILRQQRPALAQLVRRTPSVVV